MIAPPIEFPEDSPWWYLDEELSAAYTDELQKEVGPDHCLFEHLQSMKVIAKCDANDDVLVSCVIDPNRFQIVHLTWSGKQDRIPAHFPATQMIKLCDLQKFF